MPHSYHPDHYNAHGWLRLPFFFWLVLLLLARTWLLFIMAGASQGQGAALLALFYPDRAHFWWGMAMGLPAALLFLLSGRRHHWPRLWQSGWWLMLATLIASLVVQGVTLWQAADPAFSDLLLTLLDSAALAWWLLSRTLKRAFSAAENGE